MSFLCSFIFFTSRFQLYQAEDPFKIIAEKLYVNMDFSEYGIQYKKPPIEEETNKKKKGKKNNNQVQIIHPEKYKEEPSQKPKAQINESPIETLKKKFPSIAEEIITDLYEQNKKNMELTVAFLSDMVKESEAKKTSNNQDKLIKIEPNEEDYNFDKFDYLDNTVFSIDVVKEHDDLMDQVSEILESALDRTDVGQDEFDDLFSLCEENICSLIEEERKYVPDQTLEPEVDEYTREVQEFILQTIAKENESRIVDTSASNFPSLSSSTVHSQPTNSAYAQLFEKKKKTKENRIKLPADNKNKWDNHNPNNQIHQGSKAGSAKEIIALCRHFPTLNLNYIKTIYSHLDEDFEMTKKYLLTKHKEAFISEPVKHKLTPKKRVSYTIRKSEQIKIMEDETVDQILKEMTYEQIRDKVIQLSKIKLILERTAAQARAFNKYNEVHSLESAAKQQAQFLIKYSKASKKYLLDKARRNNEFFEIDLHGLYWEEAKDVITQQINYVWAKVDAEESKCKFDEKIINGRRYIKYTVITGKGNHSRHGVPVLYNNLCNFLKEKDILFDAEKNEGQIIVYIKI